MIGTTLRSILKDEKMSYQELAERSDLPLETVRNIYYGKVNDPKVSTMLAISRVLGMSINRLMGERLFSEEEEELVERYRKCGKHGKSMVMLTADYEAELSRHERNAKNKYIIPCIVPLDIVHDGLKYSSSKMVDIVTDDPEVYIAVEMTSNSFAPAFCKGDRILIADKFPANGQTALFFINGMIYLRTYEEHDDGYILRNLNRTGQSFKMKRMDKVKCIGTYAGIIRA